MRSYIYLWLCSLAFVVTTTNSSLAADKDRHVILVSLDGLAAYLFDDPKAPIPTVRELAKHGSYAPQGMEVSNPAVTWPNHTTLITGVRPDKHGVLANGALVRGPIGSLTLVDPKRDHKDLVHATSVVDLAHAAGLRTAEINWPCMRNCASMDDTFPDVPEAVDHMNPQLRSELIAKGLLTDDRHASFAATSGVVKDLIWTEAACHVIRQRKPNLMLIHLLNVDSTHHTFGPQTPASYTANGYIDMCLAKIVGAIDDAGIRDNTTIIVVSDHGFMTTPNAVAANIVLKKHNLLTAVDGRIVSARAHVISEGGVGLVYFTNPGDSKELAPKIKEIFAGQEGVANVILPEDFPKLGIAHPREYDQSPDAILVMQDGYAVSTSVEGDNSVGSYTDAKTSLGSHGFLSTVPKMNATLVLSGRGIRSGVKLEGVRNIDVAPTIAKLLDLSGLSVDGQILDDALADGNN